MIKMFRPAALLISILAILLSGCSKPLHVVKGKPFVDFKWHLHYNETRTGWLTISGYVVNRGDKRADWVQVTIFIKDPKTGVTIDSASAYINGSGPNGKSLEPAETGTFEVTVNAKKSDPYDYDRKVTWTDPF